VAPEVKIGGKWVGWGPGDIDVKVQDMKRFLKNKFRWVRDWQPPLDDSTLYDETLTQVVMAMQDRYGLPQSGLMNAETQAKCGFWHPPPTAKPWLYTVHGTGQPDPLGPGLPADTARACLDRYQWQPIGNYPAKPFPMWPSIMAGVDELNLQISSRPGKFSLAGYSQGAIVVGLVLKHALMDPAGGLHHRLNDVQKVVFWGNPMREPGIVADDHWLPPAPASPDWGGILEDRLEGLERAPFQVRDYAHKDDMYANTGFDDMGQDERAICKIVMGNNVFGGPDSILAQIFELVQAPISRAVAMFNAIMDAGLFFGSQTRAHGYDIGPAIEWLRAP
jgi:hypothetical protein